MPPAKKPAAPPVVEREVGPLRVLYLGNFDPPHSTENHVARALEYNGHEVTRVQEPSDETWRKMSTVDGWPVVPDLILWTKTDYQTGERLPSYNDPMVCAHMTLMQQAAKTQGIPVVGYHLDIWWGLAREEQVHAESYHPFFASDLVITADGGHDDEWAAQGWNHHWMPPAISLAEAEVGTHRDVYASKLAFVGSWQGHYHQESQHRFELVRWLRRHFRRDCNFWPMPGQPAIRGTDLQDLYASVDVVVGDSCFVGSGLERYWSDRIPETLGRGGFLLHPMVPGLRDQFDVSELRIWEPGAWDLLGGAIEMFLTDRRLRGEVATNGRLRVRKDHTYERRMEQLVDLLVEKDML